MENFEEIKSVYFIGIGGIAMSAVACLAKNQGMEVSGSDSSDLYEPAKSVLKKQGISYHSGYRAEQVSLAAADLYVLSAGESESNPEVKAVLSQGLRRCGFPELLYAMYQQQLRLVVAGTHGKSTTAGLLSHLLRHLDDASYMVGGVIQNYQSNFYSGSGHYAVFEGDEYKTQFDDPTPKFQYYRPDILVLTNLEFDHPDVFSNFEEMESEFRQLLSGMPEDGLVVYNADDAALAKLVRESNLASVSFGLENEADFRAEKIVYGEYTKISVNNKNSRDSVAKMLGATEEYQIQLPGRLNVYNALAAIAALRTLGFGPEQFSLDLLAYTGIKRRFEVVGRFQGAVLIDDYAHHPTAVKETLSAARLKYPDSRIWAVFEPHTYSRTMAIAAELAESFGSADKAIVSEIYPARESVQHAKINSAEIVGKINSGHAKPSGGAVYVKDKQQAMELLKKELKKGDVLVVMAVGNFNRLAYELMEKSHV